MKKTILMISIFVLSLLLLTACQSSGEVDEATADSCAKLGDFGTRLTEFGQELSQFDSPDAAAADEGLNEAMAGMQQALADFKAATPADKDTDALEDAADELDRAFRDATEGMSRKEMAAAATETFNLFNSD